MPIKFTAEEVQALESSPAALRLLADWYSHQETIAALGGAQQPTLAPARKFELRDEAIRIDVRNRG